ncbi:MAG: serine O-acetyltransferase [Devosia sp.]
MRREVANHGAINGAVEGGPSLRRLLALDLRRYNAKRGGLLGGVEAFAFAPGFALLVRHRVAARLYKAGGLRRLAGLLLWRHSTNVSGCHISLGAELEPGLFLPHPTAVVVGDGVRLGRGVTLYQSVTLGRGSDGKYPSVGDGAVIYAGAVVVGGVRIGANAVVAANAFVASSVADGTTVAGAPARPLHRSAQP